MHSSCSRFWEQSVSLLTDLGWAPLDIELQRETPLLLSPDLHTPSPLPLAPDETCSAYPVHQGDILQLLQKMGEGTSLTSQWLRLWKFHCENPTGLSLRSGWSIKMPQAMLLKAERGSVFREFSIDAPITVAFTLSLHNTQYSEAQNYGLLSYILQVRKLNGRRLMHIASQWSSQRLTSGWDVKRSLLEAHNQGGDLQNCNSLWELLILSDSLNWNNLIWKNSPWSPFYGPAVLQLD